MKAWHFLQDNGELRWPCGDITKPEVGQKLTVDPDRLELCKYGLHGSEKPLDALRYATGHWLCRDEFGGRIIRGDDKLVASERTILIMADATNMLRHFARLCALDVIDKWNAPDVVKKFLRTGDKSLREAAYSAACSAICQPACSAAICQPACSAAHSAARSVARSAARSAARAAARAAARERQNRRLTRLANELFRSQLANTGE